MLGIIAMHDRFTNNGQGCTVGTRAIATKLDTYQPNVTKLVQRLVDFGYVVRHQHPTHSQMYMHCIVYNEVSDKGVLTSRPDSRTTIGRDLEPIVARLLDEAETDSQGTINKILTSKVEKIPGRSRKNESRFKRRRFASTRFRPLRRPPRLPLLSPGSSDQ